ncbi:Acetyltransferase [Tenacibaculum litopenaei]|jgi:GNAT superfamily N-acetyltransferase|uniref:GNAT family N-acetyltransferase n=1 Tax=Tenacibaculum litopenaei TaxID=396016 RepID=UPI0038942CF0
MNIEVCSNREDAMKVVRGLNTFNEEQQSRLVQEDWIPVEFIVRNENAEIKGGILGGIGYYGGLEIRILWVSKELRGQGVGRALLARAEAFAQSNGAAKVMLDTFSFQAKEFYEKCGYHCIGSVPDFPITGQARHYFYKDL